MKKILETDSCSMCPYYDIQDYSYGFAWEKCTKLDITVSSDSIHDDCPLKNAPTPCEFEPEPTAWISGKVIHQFPDMANGFDPLYKKKL